MLTKLKKGISDYVVYDLSNVAVIIDKVSMMMINSNQNDRIGLAPISLEEMNGTYYRMLFDITGKVSLADYIKNNISQEDFRQMLLNMIHAIEEFDEYMIDIEKKQILLDAEYVYINPIDHSISFICIALQNIELNYNLCNFFRKVVQESDVALNPNEISYFNHAYRIVNGQDGGFSLPNLKIAMNKEYQANPQIEHRAKDSLKQDNHSPFEPPGVQTVDPPSPQPVDVIPQPNPKPTEEKKKKGLGGLGDALGNIFQFGKKSPSSEYQGGISSIKGRLDSKLMPNKEKNKDVSLDVPEQKSKEDSKVSSHTYQKTVPVGTTALLISEQKISGATVLSSQVQNKSEQEFPGTTVMSSQVQNKSEQEFPGTTVMSSQVQNKSEQEFPGTTVMSSQVQNKSEQEFPGTTALSSQVQNKSEQEFPGTTVFLQTACLIQVREKRLRFFIHKSVFVIGRGDSGIDCAVNDNTTVSRHHADILCSDSKYYLHVMTQHEGITHLNNVELNPGDRVQLSDGDKIFLGNEEFEFKIV